MGDVFGRLDQVYAGGLTSDASWMFWSGMPNGGLGMLITQMSIQYQQPIRRIFEIGPWTSVGTLTGGTVVGQPVYYVAGRTEGQLQLGRITGPIAAISGWYRRYGNICSYLNNLFFVSSSGCVGGAFNAARDGTGAGFAQQFASAPANRIFNGVGLARFDPYLGWYMSGVVIQSLGLSAQAQDMMVTENVQLQFIGLRLYTARGDTNLDAGGGVWSEV